MFLHKVPCLWQDQGRWAAANLRVQGLPQSVQRLREQINAADAIVIATPEYNYSIPGVLKNTLDAIGPLWPRRSPAPR